MNLIAAARREHKDARAAELSDAREEFKKEIRNTPGRCKECGVRIATRATHCRVHAPGKAPKIKALPLPNNLRRHAVKSMPPPRRRVPSLNYMAECAYWHPKVQKVIKRWEREFPPEWIEQYISSCWRSTSRFAREISIKLIAFTDEHKSLIFDLLQAMQQIRTNIEKPDVHVLEHGAGSGDQFSPDHLGHSFPRMREIIKQSTGRDFSEDALQKACQRLHLTDKNGK